LIPLDLPAQHEGEEGGRKSRREKNPSYATALPGCTKRPRVAPCFQSRAPGRHGKPSSKKVPRASQTKWHTPKTGTYRQNRKPTTAPPFQGRRNHQKRTPFQEGGNDSHGQLDYGTHAPLPKKYALTKLAEAARESLRKTSRKGKGTPRPSKERESPQKTTETETSPAALSGKKKKQHLLTGLEGCLGDTERGLGKNCLNRFPCWPLSLLSDSVGGRVQKKSRQPRANWGR